ncbi:hypothetical protein U9M48_000434 [Paspalum notatum var. saurae]|uniref:Uncharacterized protein n=1 Tax=Paspalum notatum var. saurae TaxID=547442 RepID=A0AAQ3SI43_PASNO
MPGCTTQKRSSFHLGWSMPSSENASTRHRSTLSTMITGSWLWALLPPRPALVSRHDLEDRELHWYDGVGAQDHGGRAVAEEHLVDERLVVSILGPSEEHEGELCADHQYARAAVILSEILGEAQRGGAREAAVEVEHAAAHGGAEAQEVDQAEVHAGDVRAGVGGDDEVGDVGCRAAPLGDRLLAGRRRELRHRGLDDVKARVQGRRGPVEELRVGVQERVVVVEESPVSGLAVPIASTAAGPSARGTRRRISAALLLMVQEYINSCAVNAVANDGSQSKHSVRYRDWQTAALNREHG